MRRKIGRNTWTNPPSREIEGNHPQSCHVTILLDNKKKKDKTRRRERRRGEFSQVEMEVPRMREDGEQASISFLHSFANRKVQKDLTKTGKRREKKEKRNFC
jgi:hypothetical protein